MYYGFKNKGLLLLAALEMVVQTVAAQGLTLEQCRQMAHDNYPAIGQYRMIDESRDFTLSNATKGWLPQVSASAGAYAFTDILKTGPQTAMMGIDMKSQMATGMLTVTQNVYDGGRIAAQRQVAAAQSDVQRRQLDVTMYAVDERVDELFFGILLLDEQMVLNELLQHDLATSEQTVRSMMRGGVANQSDLDAVLVERLKAEQQMDALGASRKAYVRMLGVFVGQELPEEGTLQRPADSGSGGTQWGVNRPEMQYYASQEVLLDARRRQLNAQLLPQVSLFGAGVLHTKVSGLVNNGLLAGGVSVTWNIGALYTRKNDLRKLEVERAMNDSQKRVFLFQNRLQNEQADGTISSLRKQIAKDEEIVRLRESIRNKSDKKVQMGTESVNELVRAINAVSIAKSQKAQHEIELLRETYKQKHINNEE